MAAMKFMLFSALFVASCFHLVGAELAADQGVMQSSPGAASNFSPFGLCYPHFAYSYKRPIEQRRRQIQALADAGVRWVRCDLCWPWQGYDAKTGRYSFNNVDSALNILSEAGVGILPIINMERADAVPLHEHLDRWCAFISQAVERYRGRIKCWEIWNEENFKRKFVWGTTDLEGHAANYAACLQAAYRAIKAADPDALVLYGGTSHVPIDFIDATLRHGAGKGFDVMNVHPYNTGGIPEAIADSLRQLSLLLERHGLGDRPVWVTEIGWSTSPRKATDYYMQIMPRALEAFGIRPADTTLAVLSGASNPVTDIVGMFPRFRRCDYIYEDGLSSLDPKRHKVLLAAGGEVFSAHLQVPLVEYARRGGVVILPRGYPLCTIVEKRDDNGGLRKGPDKFNVRKELKILCRASWEGGGPKAATNVAFSADGPATGSYGFKCDRYLFGDFLEDGDSFVPLAWGVAGDVRSPIAAAYRYADGGGAIVMTDVGNAAVSRITPEMQADFTVRGSLVALSAGVQRIFWYAFLSAPNSAENPDFEANYGMAQDSADGTPTPKPAFATYRFLISMMPTGSSKVSRKVLKNGVHVAEWHRPDKSRVLAAWHPTASVQITPRREPRAAFDQYGNPIHAKTDGAIPVGNSVVYFVYDKTKLGTFNGHK